MLATRLYAFLLVAGILVIAAGKIVPRGEHGSLSRLELDRQILVAKQSRTEVLSRVRVDRPEPGDDERLVALQVRFVALERERTIRNALSAGAVLALALASLLFAPVLLRKALRDRRNMVRGGDVEVEPDEHKPIDSLDAGNELATLFHSRGAAIGHLLAQPALRCEQCHTRWAPSVIGRVGKRVLIARNAPVAAKPLGEGWWARLPQPPPCVKCGSTNLVPT